MFTFQFLNVKIHNNVFFTSLWILSFKHWKVNTLLSKLHKLSKTNIFFSHFEETRGEKPQKFRILDQSAETLDELKSDLNKDILKAVIGIYQPSNNSEIQNRTDQVLEKLELEQEFVQDLESVQVMGEEHEKELEANLEYNALTGYSLSDQLNKLQNVTTYSHFLVYVVYMKLFWIN